MDGPRATLFRPGRALLPALALAALAAGADAGGRRPGSVLVFPVQSFGTDSSTVLAVANTNTTPSAPFFLGGTTGLLFEYVNVSPTGQCSVIDRPELLTPGDSLSVTVDCHNAGKAQRGYVVVTATDPMFFKTPWAFDHLVGTQYVATPMGGLYALEALSFSSPLFQGQHTDLDFDGERDFDGLEYEAIADVLYLDSFVAANNSSLALINLTGGTEHQATVKLDVWNDNEFPLSATWTFKCWSNEPLYRISTVFTHTFLADNTPHDPQELDIDCNGVGDFETGWARISGLTADSGAQAIPNPAILGALVVSTPDHLLDAGMALWESTTKQTNGDFLHQSTVHPEY